MGNMGRSDYLLCSSSYVVSAVEKEKVKIPKATLTLECAMSYVILVRQQKFHLNKFLWKNNILQIMKR